MLFNSINFLIFFPVVVCIYFLLAHKYRALWLLVVSCYFYAVFIPKYIFILFFLIIVDYFAGLYIESAKTLSRKKLFLILSLIANISVLGLFKYFNFFSANASAIAQAIGWNYSLPVLQIILPIGLSFHTFQSISYTIEVYRGKQKAEHNIFMYALYVMFFPQLVAGPIERPQNLIHQFYEKHDFEYKRVTDGLKLMLWGFFKKVVIADRLSLIVNTVYGSPSDYNGLALVLATVFFAFQIYADFSGYSDIAIGAAQVMGFKLMDNFKRPYFSRSISEFWKRWHISLSTWFKDYLYISLGGNRVSIPRWYFNLFFVFLVSGFWHGANWTFIIWGALHGLYLILEIVLDPLKKAILKFTHLINFPKIVFGIELFFTFVLVCIGWIFFRANTVSDAFYIITHLFSNWSFDFNLLINSQLIPGFPLMYLLYCVAIIGFMEFIHIIQEHRSIRQFLDDKNIYIRWFLYLFMLLLILLFGVFNNTHFIYFQF